MNRAFASVLLTGASSGIGAALAVRLARPEMRLVLGGRHAQRLEDVAETCRSKGAVVEDRSVDVTDDRAMAAWVQDADRRAPLDLVIANAGISGEDRPPGDNSALARRIYAVNVLGTLNTVEPVLPAMRARRRGTICLIASFAGLIGMPRGPAYSGSKAALIVHGQAWQAALAADGIRVSVACPGYVRTPLTARHQFSMPWLIDPEDAAAAILGGVAAGRHRILFPWQLRLAGWLASALPSSLIGPFLPGGGRDDS